MSQPQAFETDLGNQDIATLVNALLESIRRGELDAGPDEVRFLESVARILPQPREHAR